MIAYELLAKKASPKAMAVIPLRMLMPNGYMDTNIPSLFTELRYTGDVFDRVSILSNDTITSLYGNPNTLNHGIFKSPEKDANSDMFKRTCHSQFEGFGVRTHRFANVPDREAYTVRESIGARRIDELNRELENALQSYSLQLTEAFARIF